MKQCHGEKGSIRKPNAITQHAATCISCGSTNGIELWPHRTDSGEMVGFIFVCSACEGLAMKARIITHGVGEHILYCPKCGGTDIHTRFRKKGDELDGGFEGYLYTAQTDVLRRTCITCQFRWNDEPLDKAKE